MIVSSTFVCPTELIAVDEKYAEFKKLNAEVIGISVDSQFSHLGWMNTKRSVCILFVSLISYVMLVEISVLNCF